MDEMKEAFRQLVRAWTKTNKVLGAYVEAGLDSNMLFWVCGEIEQTLCILTGEADLDLEKTVTHAALTAPILSEDRRVKMLEAAYMEHHPAQPAPVIVRPDAIRNSVKQTGGYLHETPEGGWV